MEHIIAQLDHRPAEDLILIHKVILVFVAGQLRVVPDAVLAAVGINQAFTVEQAHDASGLCRHNRRDNRVVGPGRGAEGVGNLPNGGHAVIHMANALHDIRQHDGVRLDGGVGDGELFRAVG